MKMKFMRISVAFKAMCHQSNYNVVKFYRSLFEFQISNQKRTKQNYDFQDKYLFWFYVFEMCLELNNQSECNIYISHFIGFAYDNQMYF